MTTTALPVRTSLMADEVYELPVALVTKGVELGVIKLESGRWSAIKRHCTCGEELPFLVNTDRKVPTLDTFPRCSRHAF